jgi:hypothetical protein
MAQLQTNPNCDKWSPSLILGLGHTTLKLHHMAPRLDHVEQ